MLTEADDLGVVRPGLTQDVVGEGEEPPELQVVRVRGLAHDAGGLGMGGAGADGVGSGRPCIGGPGRPLSRAFGDPRPIDDDRRERAEREVVLRAAGAALPVDHVAQDDVPNLRQAPGMELALGQLGEPRECLEQVEMDVERLPIACRRPARRGQPVGVEVFAVAAVSTVEGSGHEIVERGLREGPRGRIARGDCVLGHRVQGEALAVHQLRPVKHVPRPVHSPVPPAAALVVKVPREEREPMSGRLLEPGGVPDAGPSEAREGPQKPGLGDDVLVAGPWYRPAFAVEVGVVAAALLVDRAVEPERHDALGQVLPQLGAGFLEPAPQTVVDHRHATSI